MKLAKIVRMGSSAGSSVVIFHRAFADKIPRSSNRTSLHVRWCQQRTFCDALHYVPRKGSELGADVPEAAYVGLPLLREFERRRDMADEYAGCH